MLRVVLATVLAAALVGTAFHALDSAARDHANADLERTAERLTAAAADLRDREQAVPAGRTGARRVVTVRVPAEDWTTAPVEYLAVGGRPTDQPSGSAPAVSWRVAGSYEQTRHVTGVRVVGRDETGHDGVVVVEEPGTHRLALTLVEVEGRETVVVRRLD